LHLQPFVLSAQVNSGLRILLDQPEQVGADRLANAAAVAALYGSPAIAVDLGTATKFEAVERGGVYRGGAIAPGILLARDALISKAALLPQVEIAPPPSPIGTNTADAVRSGTFWGYVSLVEAMIARIKPSLGGHGVRVVATGGLTPLIRKYVPLIDLYAETLTLDGIRILYEFNH
jgi:type III pantothenate kinase